MNILFVDVQYFLGLLGKMDLIFLLYQQTHRVKNNIERLLDKAYQIILLKI